MGSGLFAAVAGSSAATCATIGRMSYPELTESGYFDRMIIGMLELLIPPSIMPIVYGISARVSIARLFIAGILLGLAGRGCHHHRVPDDCDLAAAHDEPRLKQRLCDNCSNHRDKFARPSYSDMATTIDSFETH